MLRGLSYLCIVESLKQGTHEESYIYDGGGTADGLQRHG
jgi:hypothetical protein